MILAMADKAGLSRYQLSKLSDVDDSYFARLESGKAANPGRGILLSLALSLVRYTSLFGRSDVDSVLEAAGFPPSPEHLWNQSAYCCCKDSSDFGNSGRW